jgi:hypothetical protein
MTLIHSAFFGCGARKPHDVQVNGFEPPFEKAATKRRQVRTFLNYNAPQYGVRLSGCGGSPAGPGGKAG